MRAETGRSPAGVSSLAILAALAAGALAVGGCGQGSSAGTPGSPGTPAARGATPDETVSRSAAPPRTVAVRRGSLRESVTGSGTFRSRQVSRLGARVSGTVLEVLVDVGDAVRKGQVLAKIDPSSFAIDLDLARAKRDEALAEARQEESAVAIAEAEVRVSDASLQDAELLLQRMRSLWEKPSGETPSIPKSRLDDAEFRQKEAAARREAARARVAEAKAKGTWKQASVGVAEQEIRQAERDLADTAIGAPYDGVVSRRLVDPGEQVTATPVTHLVEIQETSTLELEFSLPQVHLASVRKGTRVEFRVDGVPSAPTEGTVDMVYPDLDEATRSFRCRVLVPNRDGLLRPGLLAHVSAPVREVPDALLVPAAALFRGNGGWAVKVLDGGTETVRTVETGVRAEAEVQVVSGVKEGEAVVLPAATTGTDR